MRKLCNTMVMLVASCVLSSSVAECNSTDALDGGYWNSNSKLNQIVYINGYFDGLYQGASRLEMISKSTRAQTTEQKLHLLTFMFTKITTNELIEGLNSFYTDTRNVRINIGDAIWLVAAKKINLMSPEDLEKWIEEYRSSP